MQYQRLNIPNKSEIAICRSGKIGRFYSEFKVSFTLKYDSMVLALLITLGLMIVAPIVGAIIGLIAAIVAPNKFRGSHQSDG